MSIRRAGERALIFDMDGVLIDSEPIWRRVEIEVFGELGVVLEEADCFQTQGFRLDEAVAYWYERFPWRGRSLEDVSLSIIDRMIRVIESQAEPMPGAIEAIDWAARTDWRIALASSSASVLIETVLDRFGISDRFECRRSAEHERAGKPHPDVYLSAARDLGLDPRACVAIEDSANGVASALAAGMRCIAIPPPETREDPRFDAATLRLDSLQSLPDALSHPIWSDPRAD